MENLENVARIIRGKLVEMSYYGKAAHLGSALSCIEILVAAYWGGVSVDPLNPDRADRDRFILSKGHAASALYATLALKGFFPVEDLATYGFPESRFEEHPAGCIPGVELGTGSLGHGLPVGIGMALASHLNKEPYRVFVLMSDGECNEGSVWEASMFAAAQCLENVTVIIDFNKWQATGRSQKIMKLDPLAEKFEAFGWRAVEVDGHDIGEVLAAMDLGAAGSGKPLAIIAHTVKGKGISFMENDNNWHYRIPDREEVIAAKKELGLL